MMRLPGAVTLLLLGMFLFFGYYAGFFVVMSTWDYRTWALFFLVSAFFWNARNEFGGGGGGK